MERRGQMMHEGWGQWEGQVLDARYPLRQCLAGGARSAVFLTELSEPAGQKAAVKLLAVDAARAKSLLARAQGATKLEHSGLLKIFDAGLTQRDGQTLIYVVMEYAEEDLSQVLRLRALTPEETQEVMESCLEALAYLHGQGYIHGHLKPANIMAVEDRIKIAWDGLLWTGDPAGLWAATPYEAPETPHSPAAAAADVWSLAMVMVEGLTQQRPTWEGTAIRRLVLPDMPAAPFREIARNCLQDDPQLRWSVNRMIARLTPGAPPPVERPAVPPQEVERKRGYLPVAVGAAVVLAVVLVGASLFNRSSSATSPATTPAPVAKIAPAPTAPAAKTVEQARPSPFDAKKKVKRAGPAAGETASVSPKPAPAASAAPAPPVAAPVVPRRSSGAVVRQVLPEVPARAQATIQGKVRIRVKVEVDASGNVTGAALDGSSSGRYFEPYALAAARKWKFEPGGPAEWRLQFDLRRSGTEAKAERSKR